MLETTGIQKDGRYILPPMQQELHARWMADCGTSFIRARWTKVGTSKTEKQVKTHFGLAVERVRQAMIEKGYGICGVPPNKDMVHDILSKACGGVGPLGEHVRLSEMTSEECCRYFENIKDWVSNELHIVIPEPDPNWKENKNDG